MESYRATNCEPSLINYSESKSRFWKHNEALERQRIPMSLNTRSGKKSFTKCAINLPACTEPSQVRATPLLTSWTAETAVTRITGRMAVTRVPLAFDRTCRVPPN